MNAALYAAIGYSTYFGIIVFGVRFWPAVVIPAIFSVLFGPLVGGLGAAVGIFIADMLTHGMPLLSLSVGVTANFACFYVIGVLAGQERYELKRYLLAAIVGLGLGSLIIGIGIWGWSQFFVLPGKTAVEPMRIIGAALTAAWTFISEIPFLLIIPPIVVKAYKG